MENTVLVYSSHDRCNHIHNDWIVQRALAGNKRILYLPLSGASDDGKWYENQHYSWETFSWFFSFYRPYGLEAFPFFWTPELHPQDVELLWDALASSEVVILGGGNPRVGMWRFLELGERFAHDPDRFANLLRNRKAKGQLTVGFSAGVDQLCEYMSSASGYGAETRGYGLCRNIVATSHFAPGHESQLHELAHAFGHCLVFGLPNDSGLAVRDGVLASGRRWQEVTMITDNSWDRPEDADHIKTRQGILIQHVYPDSRDWAFNGGDALLRLQSDDGSYNEAFILTSGQPALDYWTRDTTGFHSVADILAAR